MRSKVLSLMPLFATASSGSLQLEPSLTCRDDKYLLAARENNDTGLIAYQSSSLEEALLQRAITNWRWFYRLKP